MTIKPFDQFNKQLFQKLLSPFGTVTANRNVLGEERAIDILFEPDPDVVFMPDEIGCLANMSAKTSLFEPFRSNLQDYEVHGCFIKLFLLYAEIQRQSDRIVPTTNLPQLWILAADVSDLLIQEFGGILNLDQGEGFYRLATRINTTIVVIDELPVSPDTLWLRLMGKGRVQEDAITELLLLPESNPKRNSALDLLVSWRISMEVLEQVDTEERRILMALSQAYLEWEKQTQQKGIDQAQQKAVVSILSTRFGCVDRQLELILPAILEMSIEDSTPLLLQLSREDLLQRFSAH